MKQFWRMILVISLQVLAIEGNHQRPAAATPAHATLNNALSFDYYMNSCPQLEQIVHNKIMQWIKRDRTLAPALIRLHFHDCAVRGCDGSILLNHKGSERKANASMSLRGFEAINDIKQEVEKKCPKTVSCADILTVAARDATLAVGGPFWMVPFGRKDGRVSLAKEADHTVPIGRESVTRLINFFQSNGLNVLDLVVLSGAHTIGRSTCESLQFRLSNYNGTRKPDPTINRHYRNLLKRKCKKASDYVNLDGVTPNAFDVQYYTNLEKKMGVLLTDQLLYSDRRTEPLVAVLASQPSVFEPQFAASMVKLGNILDHFNNGEVRLNCERINTY
nr:peroxidase 7-like [Ipomoea trifida]